MVLRRQVLILFLLYIVCLLNFTTLEKINLNNSGILDGMKIKDAKDNTSALIDYIYITGSNWTEAKNLGLCSGEGNVNSPYVLEGFVINATGSPTGSGILIENSEAYFVI